MNPTRCLGDYKMVRNGYSSINMKNEHNIILPFFGVWISLSRGSFVVFSVIILIQFNLFTFLINPIEHLGDHKILGNVSISLNMNN